MYRDIYIAVSSTAWISYNSQLCILIFCIVYILCMLWHICIHLCTLCLDSYKQLIPRIYCRPTVSVSCTVLYVGTAQIQIVFQKSRLYLITTMLTVQYSILYIYTNILYCTVHTVWSSLCTHSCRDVFPFEVHRVQLLQDGEILYSM